MKKIIFVGYLLMISFINYAQKCNGIDLDTLHGKWIYIKNDPTTHESNLEILKEKQYMDGVNELVKKNINWVPVGGDIGYEIVWEGEGRRPAQLIKITNTFYSSFDFKRFSCDNGKITHSYDVADFFTTRFNDLPFEFDHSFYSPGPKATDADTDPGTDTYAILHWLPVVKDGFFDYIQDHVDGTGNNASGYVYRYRTIIKPGKLPYLLMTKKEFYAKWRIKHSIEIENIEAGKNRYKKDLAGNDQLPVLLKQADQFEGIYQNYINKIDGILKNKSAEELSKPAFEGEQEGEYFESIEASVYKAYIVKPNYDYYNYKLNNKSSPQVITCYMRYGTDKNEQGIRAYSDPAFYKALEDMKIYDLLAEKLRPLIVQ
jgi:hypothetical protein